MYREWPGSIAANGCLGWDGGVADAGKHRCNVKTYAKKLAIMGLVVMPGICQAQKLGRVACSKPDGTAVLYGTVATMEIRATLKCGQQLQILDRSDNFVHVLTENGVDGYVAANALTFLKTAPAAKPVASRAKQKHAAPSAATESAVRVEAPAPPREIVLARQTPVHLKLGRALSSATAHTGDEVPFEVTQDVVVGGVTVIAKGATAIGAVIEAEPKKRMGKAGKLNVGVNSVVLVDNERIVLRSFGIEQGADPKSGMSMPLLRGKDVTLATGAEITAYVDADVRLKVASFAGAGAATQALSQSDTAKP
jgi:hypothetical protein